MTLEISESSDDSLRKLDSYYITSEDEILKYINSSLDEIDENILPKIWIGEIWEVRIIN